MTSSSDAMRVERITLPDNFAQNVLELEELAASQVDISILNRLMGLYSQAIEFYESQKDKKFKHYLSRMRILMSRPEVLALLNQPQISPAKKKQKTKIKVTLAADRSAQKAIKDFNEQSFTTACLLYTSDAADE